MPNPTRIALVRHGHVNNPDGIFYGRLPGFKLSPEGSLQGEAAARYLKRMRLAVIFSSPMLRARRTALTLQSAQPGVSVRITKLLTEVHTPYDGQPLEHVIAKNWNVYDHFLEGYEQPGHVLERGRKFLDRMRRDYAGKNVAAVTHGDVILFLVHWAKGVPIDLEKKQILQELGFPVPYPDPACIVTFTFHTNAQDELPTVEYVSPYSTSKK